MGQLNYIIRIIDYAHGFPHSKKSLLLDGIGLPSGQLSEEQAVASTHVALSAQVTPAVQPVGINGSIRWQTSSQPTIIYCHHIGHQYKWIRQHTCEKPSHSLRAVLDLSCMTRRLIYSVCVYEVSKHVADPQGKNVSQ